MPASKPSLRFTHSPALRTQTLKVLAAIEDDPDPTRHAEALTSLVLSLTETGMDYYLLKPLKDGKFSFIAQQAASFGISGALRIMTPIAGTVLGGADAKQLKVISKHMRQLME
jgi:hypothetical protein